MHEPAPSASAPPPNLNSSVDRFTQATAGALTNGGAALLGVLWAGPEGAVAAAAAGGAAQIYVERWMLALSGLWERAAEEYGPDALRDLLASKPEKAALLVDASEAMARSSYEAKVEAIARAIASGMLYEDDVRFDVDAHIVRITMALDRPHVAILMELGDNYLHEDDLKSSLAQYTLVLPSLLNELRRLGLTDGFHEPKPGLSALEGHKVTELGRDVRQRLQSAAEALRKA